MKKTLQRNETAHRRAKSRERNAFLLIFSIDSPAPRYTFRNAPSTYEDDVFQSENKQQMPISLSNVEMRHLLFFEF